MFRTTSACTIKSQINILKSAPDDSFSFYMPKLKSQVPICVKFFDFLIWKV